MTGIYAIKNKVNGKLYIGSSEQIERRFTDHKYLLNKEIHHSISFQRSWNKYGSKNFKFEIIEECSIEVLLEREQYWMNKLLKADEYLNDKNNFFLKNGYNILPKSIKGFTGKHSKDTIIKLLKTQKRYNRIFRVDTEGNIIGIYDFQKECPDIRQVVSRSIKNGNTLFNKNYGYILEKDYIEKWVPTIKKHHRQDVPNTWMKTKEVYVYDIYGRFYQKFKSYKECAQEFEKTVQSLSNVINKNKVKIQEPYLFFDKEQNLKYSILELSENKDILKVYTLMNEFIGYSNYNELSEKLNTSYQCIRTVINKKRKQLKGYIIIENEDIV